MTEVEEVMQMHKPMIAIDVGHGGPDPGAIGYQGLRESDVNLDIGLRLRDYLRTNFMCRVWMSRTTDMRPLNRIGPADQERHISIHANWFADDRANGFESFRWNGPLLSTTTAYHKTVHREVAKYIHDIGKRDRGKKRADFHTLRLAPSSAILMEYGFISNPAEAKILNNSHHQRMFAKYTAEGIAKDMKLIRRTKEKPVDEWDAPDSAVFELISAIKTKLAELNRALGGLPYDER